MGKFYLSLGTPGPALYLVLFPSADYISLSIKNDEMNVGKKFNIDYKQITYCRIIRHPCIFTGIFLMIDTSAWCHRLSLGSLVIF